MSFRCWGTSTSHAGKTLSAYFCASFGYLVNVCTKHLASIKSLAYDGWFIKCYAIELERYHGELLDHVKEAVPSSLDSHTMARFIERFGTHGVSMGGKDVLYLRQENTSYLDPTSILQNIIASLLKTCVTNRGVTEFY
ncbi:hypothetical protein VNO78_10510 [Psophocarpus tetragonolobus]|uniref:MACPF domain-containing protein n=1 Tax=Psophocarpus tetragonolobus TaxID=3891 RepID=A0AAN9SRI8_PSOTE